MGFRECTNYGGVVDRLIGNAFDVVKAVHDQLDAIKYVAANIEAIVQVAQQFQINNPQIVAAVTAAANMAAAAGLLENETKANAYIIAWLNSLPVWDGVSALPVNTGQWFLNNGKPEQAQ